jgi:hypothetical protein
MMSSLAFSKIVNFQYPQDESIAISQDHTRQTATRRKRHGIDRTYLNREAGGQTMISRSSDPFLLDNFSSHFRAFV